MTIQNTGGSAFPTPSGWNHQGDWTPAQSESEGMTLRDYFAAKAMQAGIGLIPNMKSPRDGVTFPQAITEMAYEYADAMLKARGNT